MFGRITVRKIKRISKILFFVSIFVIVYIFTERAIMPSLIELSQTKAKIIANKAIDNAVKETVASMDIGTEDFFVYLNEGKQITANTILINKLCAEVSTNINERVAVFEGEKIFIPLGALTGVNLLFNAGPKINFSIRQSGETNVDYETSFSSAGINQTNYKAWMNVKLKIKLILPLKSVIVTTERKIMLIDTVIEGKVPEGFLKME